MSPYLATYWQLRLERCKQALEKNHFGAHIAADCDAARRIVLEGILPGISFRTVSWGDSLTLRETGVLDALMDDPRVDVLATFAPGVPEEEISERRRQALLVDVFFTGSNAVTESGQLVNLDMVGNRVGGITFGPRHVILFVGRNKLVVDIPAAMQRIKSHAAPANAIRHPGLQTPCMKTGVCMDCNSPDRICNTWTVNEKSFPKGRIQVVLINADLGL